MSGKTLGELLKPIIPKMREDERQTLKAHLSKVKYWIDLARGAHKDRRNVAGIQQGYMHALKETEEFLREKKHKIEIPPRLLWPAKIPFSMDVKAESHGGSPLGTKEKMITRVKDKPKPLKLGTILARVTAAERKMREQSGKSKKPTKHGPMIQFGKPVKRKTPPRKK
ncbi:MAG: hypothetical protein FJY86_04580 [Candidatus Diapherotrites archaeon]|uniref:Uncharacterized protein n=1 Tax=Candidatus Iainarchaeum sp. TaxID=3101447 RepID=A0A8T4C7V7_9ARCH|nr:hypothetical protein [Candidatus Diapherotrites archaeon]